MVGVGRSSRLSAEKSADNLCTHTASFAASDAAMYSACYGHAHIISRGDNLL